MPERTDPAATGALSDLDDLGPELAAGVRSGLSARFDLHAFGLLAVLLLLFPVVVGHTIWSADIGARLYQAVHLLETGDWPVTHPIPRADPDGLYFPFHLSAATENDVEFVVFPKHPLLVWLTAGLYRVGGLRAIVLVQTIATFGASVGAARLVARTRPSMAVQTLWFTGVVSPLFFDGYLGYNHSLAAALLVWAGVLALQFVDPKPSGASPGGLVLVGAAILVALACLVRTEATLGGLALAAGLFVSGLRRWARSRWNRSRWTATFVVIGLSTVTATVVNQLIRPANLGLANPDHANNPWGGLMMGRIEGFQRTWLSPGQTPRDLLILMIAVLIIVFGWLIRDRSQATMITVVLGVTLALAVVRALAPEPVLIFGLLMASPLLILGLVKALPLMNDNSEMMLCGVTFGAFAVAVAATQYRFGGVAEWGGRYFAAGLPFAIAAAVPGLGRIQNVFPPVQKRRIVALALATALTVNLAGLRSLADSRDRTRAMADEIAGAMADVRLRDLTEPGSKSLAFSSTEEPKPIVVTTITAVGRLSWDVLDDGAWLLVDDGELDRMARTLRQLDVYRFTLVSLKPGDDLTEIGQYYETESWVVTDDVPAEVIIVTAIDRP